MNKYVIPKATCRIVLNEGTRSYIPAMSGPDSAIRLMQQEMAELDREMMAVVNLNSQLEPINWHIVSIGGMIGTTFFMQNIFKTAILSNATKIMLFHNHPSGNSAPSDADVKTTKTIKKAGKLLGIPLVDHIIIGAYGDYYSFAADARGERNL